MRVIGTAGHVDHGKSTLIEALTGTHPDRLKEEREREMTIDLGFAWMTLPGGDEIGIVDVPGHRDFIENMLAGVGGIDAALFVIAADEGVMPQTREHLAILDILQIQGGVIALTKIDLVGSDEQSRTEWLDLVEEDVRSVMVGTIFEDAPVVRVSARTREGLDDLIQALQSCLSDRPPRSDTGKPRLPVDRVFTIAGFGTVVTGTLTDGKLKAGDELEILPAKLRGRVRGLQTHKRKEDTAVPGSRTAVNISGINVDQIKRGDVVTHPSSYNASKRIDVRFRLHPDASLPLEHNTELKLYIGAAEVVSRVRLLGAEVLNPGDNGWLQLELSEPVVAVRGDRYILRRPSPGETLGGGTIVDMQPKKRHKRFDLEVISRLESLEKGTPADVLLQAFQSLGITPLQNVIARSSLGEEQAKDALDELLISGDIFSLEGNPDERKRDSLFASRGYWNQISSKASAEVETYHSNYPLRKGMPREELKSRMKTLLHNETSQRIFLAVIRRLVQEGELEEIGPLVCRPGHEIRFKPVQQRQVDELLARFAASPNSPPTLKDAQAEAGEDVVAALIDLGELVQLPPDVLFRRDDYNRMVSDIRTMITTQGPVSAAQVRDKFNTSRRYVLALLEHLDSIGVTVREGDVRRLK